MSGYNVKAGDGFTSPTELVTLKIGPEAKAFLVHKQYACAASQVFKAAFNSPFIEGETQTYVLEDTTEEVGRLLVAWIYGLYLDVDDDDEARDTVLIELWVLADKLIMRDLQDCIITTWYDSRDTAYFCYNIACLPFAYENTAKDSQLRKFLVDMFVAEGKTDLLLTHPEMFPKDFLLELASRSISMSTSDERERALGISKSLDRYFATRGKPEKTKKDGDDDEDSM